MAKLDSLKGAAVVFFTDDATGSRYQAFPAAMTYVYVQNFEAHAKALLDACDIPYADEPNPRPRGLYGVELVSPEKLVSEYLKP